MNQSCKIIQQLSRPTFWCAELLRGLLSAFGFGFGLAFGSFLRFLLPESEPPISSISSSVSFLGSAGNVGSSSCLKMSTTWWLAILCATLLHWKSGEESKSLVRTFNCLAASSGSSSSEQTMMLTLTGSLLHVLFRNKKPRKKQKAKYTETNEKKWDEKHPLATECPAVSTTTAKQQKSASHAQKMSRWIFWQTITWRNKQQPVYRIAKIKRR